MPEFPIEPWSAVDRGRRQSTSGSVDRSPHPRSRRPSTSIPRFSSHPSFSCAQKAAPGAWQHTKSRKSSLDKPPSKLCLRVLRLVLPAIPEQWEAGKASQRGCSASAVAEKVGAKTGTLTGGTSRQVQPALRCSRVPSWRSQDPNQTLAGPCLGVWELSGRLAVHWLAGCLWVDGR